MEPEVGVALHRINSPAHIQGKKSFLSKLRRASSSNSPYDQSSHAASTSALPSGSNIRQTSWISSAGSSTVKKNQVGVPIMMGVNRSEEIFGTSTSIKHGFCIEDELEWERVKTLPRVRLVPPPEEESEPIMLYPPPHMTRPSTPPPILPHPFLSPPSSPPTSPPRRPGSPPQSPPKRPTSIYSQSPTWAGMADGFVLPPPKFSRNSVGWTSTAFGGNNIVMPKRRAEVAEDRRKRMSGINIAGSPPTSPPAIVVSGMMRSLESQEEIAANKRMRIEEAVKVDVKATQEGTMDRVLVETKDIVTSPVDMDVDRIPSPPLLPHEVVISKTSNTLSSSETNTSISQMPVDPPAPIPVRRSRALSLSAALSSSSLKNAAVPPLPDLPRPPIRKQRSLKKFFFSSSTPPEAASTSSCAPPVPPLPLRERTAEIQNIDSQVEQDKILKSKKVMKRARSKPSLKIDVKGSKSSSSAEVSPVTPALSTDKTDISAIMDTPSAPAPLRGLSKRFSLSNMSQAFKKRSHSTPVSATSSTSPIPLVPDIPEAYKKEKYATGSSAKQPVPPSPRKAETIDTNKNQESILSTSVPRRSESLKAIQSLTFLSDEIDKPSDSATEETSYSTMIVDEPQSLLPAFEVPETSITTIDSPTDGRVSTSERSIISISTVDIDDIDGDIEDEHEVIHAQLMHISPRTRRDPTQSLSLQEFLASPPGKPANVVIVPTHGLRRSVEAVFVLDNPMLLNLQSPPSNDPHQEIDEDESSTVQSVDTRRQSKVIERRGSETESEEEISTPLEAGIEIFPNQQEEEDEEPTPKASSYRISQNQIASIRRTSLENGEQESLLRLDSLPKALLKRLHSTRKQHQSTPYHSKKNSKSSDKNSTVLSKEIPLPPLPIDEMEFSSLKREMQLRSLKFESLGLNFQDWNQAQLEELLAGA
uniref:Uncharacterized protein n=1 Tax=Kwoniella pini CBS 10737 TaxID=1296096 RepID=A0A1B9HVI3_9TREE|nr:uncharacterized protein I206_07046 [Kwoniella pini CBS 10737]OCF47268.1 hypothetical protein I206_07046 [Kwoniella pini CBS 10737]